MRSVQRTSRKLSVSSLYALLCVSVTLPALSTESPADQKSAKATESPTTPSSGLGLGAGDLIVVQVDTPGFSLVDADTDSNSSATTYCAGKGTVLRLSSVSTDGQIFYVRVITVHDARVGEMGVRKPPDTADNRTRKQNHEKLVYVKACQIVSGEELKPGVQYQVQATAFTHHEYGASGIEYGVLLAPFKFHIADRGLTTSATVGPYVGYHLITSPGSTLSEVLSVGIGSVSATTESTSSGQSTTNNLTSVSVAGGTVLTLTKSGKFQVAFLIGIDWAGHSSNYQYNGKPWLGIGFGTDLTK